MNEKQYCEMLTFGQDTTVTPGILFLLWFPEKSNTRSGHLKLSICEWKNFQDTASSREHIGTLQLVGKGIRKTVL